MKKIKLEKACYEDFCNWESNIIASLSNDLQSQIEMAQSLIGQKNFIESINICPPNDFLDEETSSKLYDQCAYDVALISVYEHGIYFTIQAKWDSRIQAEYTVVEEEQK